MQPAPNSGKWTPSPFFLAQSTHVGWAVAIECFFTLQGVNPWWSVLAILLVSAVKEFWADIFWLEKDSVSGSALDFTFWQTGSLTCRLALWNPILGGFALVLIMLALMMWDIESTHE